MIFFSTPSRDLSALRDNEAAAVRGSPATSRTCAPAESVRSLARAEPLMGVRPWIMERRATKGAPRWAGEGRKNAFYRTETGLSVREEEPSEEPSRDLRGPLRRESRAHLHFRRGCVAFTDQILREIPSLSGSSWRPGALGRSGLWPQTSPTKIPHYF